MQRLLCFLRQGAANAAGETLCAVYFARRSRVCYIRLNGLCYLL